MREISRFQAEYCEPLLRNNLWKPDPPVLESKKAARTNAGFPRGGARFPSPGITLDAEHGRNTIYCAHLFNMRAVMGAIEGVSQ
jgi:hypothetical protein